MAKVKFDVSGSDPEAAIAGGGEPPKPGVYDAVLVSAELGYKKGDDGKPDKTQQRLEPIVRINDSSAKSPDNKDANGFPLYDYIGFTDAQEWKLDQFLQAFGLATATKRTGTIDTDKLKGLPCRIRVKQDTFNGVYSPKVGAWIAAGEGSSGGDDDLEDELEDLEEVDGGGGDDEVDPFAEGGDDEATGYTEEALRALEPKALGAVAKDEFGIDLATIPGKGKAKVDGVIAAILEAQNDDPFAE